MTAPPLEQNDKLEQAVAELVRARVPEEKIRAFIASEKQRARVAAPTTEAPTTEEPTVAVPRGRAADITRSALGGLSFGMLTKPIAAVEALTADDKSRPFSERYESFKRAEREAQHDYEREHFKENLAIQLGAGLIPTLLTGGAGAVGEAGALARAGRAAWTGAKLGGVAGFVNADGSIGNRLGQGALEGGVGALLGGGLSAGGSAVGSVARAAGVPEASSRMAQFLADKIRASGGPSKAPRYLVDALERVSGSLGSKGEAAEKVAQRIGADRTAGSQIIPTTKVASPNVYAEGTELAGLGKGVMRAPGEGRAVLRGAVEEHAENLRPNVERELEQVTGVRGGQGTKPLKRTIERGKQEMDVAFDEARAETEGDPVESETLNQILKTPSGRRAYDEARTERMNRQRPLPKVTEQIVHAEMPEALRAMKVSEEAWQKRVADALANGEKLPGVTVENVTREVPDAELIHMMKRNLSKYAKLGARGDVEGGKLASEAQANSLLFQKMRDELPEAFQEADRVATEAFQQREGRAAGLKIFGTKQVPGGGSSKGMVNKSLGGVEERIAGHSPETQEEFRQGAAQAALERFARAPEGRRLKHIVGGSAESRAQLKNAFRSEADFRDFMETMRGSRALETQGQKLLGGSDTAENIAEAAARKGGSVLGSLLKGNFGTALKETSAGLSAKAEQRVNKEVARILASYDRGLLTQAQKSAAIRAAVFNGLSKAAGVVGVQRAESAIPR